MNLQINMSRISKTQHNKRLLIEAMIKSMGVVTQACKMAKLDRATFYNYYNSDPEFKKACDECQDIALDFVESRLMKQIESGDTTGIIFYLKTKGKHRGYMQTSENYNHNINQNFDGADLTVDV
jgi:hypothetical protein